MIVLCRRRWVKRYTGDGGEVRFGGKVELT